jgi:hypothetical protein
MTRFSIQSTAPIEKRRLPVYNPPGKRLTTQLTVQSGWLRIIVLHFADETKSGGLFAGAAVFLLVRLRSVSCPISRKEASRMSQPLPMSTYPLEKLLHLWRTEQLTVEQAIGHLLQHQAALEAQSLTQQKQMQSLQQAIKSLVEP